jgi:hypothetical protein
MNAITGPFMQSERKGKWYFFNVPKFNMKFNCYELAIIYLADSEREGA